MVNYKFGDGWIFRAIHLTNGEGGIDLDRMIGTADFINKAIPTVEEVNHACSKLIELDFLEIVNGKLLITDSGNHFIESIDWDLDRSQHPYEFASAVADKLDEVKSIGDEFEKHFTKKEIQSAHQKYSDNFNRLLVGSFGKNEDDR
jgi:hypothetical protein